MITNVYLLGAVGTVVIAVLAVLSIEHFQLSQTIRSTACFGDVCATVEASPEAAQDFCEAFKGHPTFDPTPDSPCGRLLAR